MLCECQMHCLSINAPLCPFFSAKSFGEEELNPPTILSHSFRINILMTLNLPSQNELQIEISRSR